MLHTDEPFQVNSWTEIPRVIAMAEAQGAIGTAHLTRALRDGRIAFFPVLPDTSATRFKEFARATSRKPSVVLVGDDDGMDRGPHGWRIAERAVRWAQSIMLHAAGAEIAHYEMAIIAAQLVHRILIIECGTATPDAWVNLIRAAPHRPSVLVIYPRGGMHPLPLDRSKTR